MHQYFLIRFRLSSTLKCQKTLIETTEYDALDTVFKSHRFNLSALGEKRFLNDAFLKGSIFEPFSKTSVFIRVFCRLTLDDKRKRIKKECVF